jgi:hypothetical protein
MNRHSIAGTGTRQPATATLRVTQAARKPAR